VVFVFVRSLRGVAINAPWRSDDMMWLKGAAHLMTAQAVVGMLLYATSPFVRALFDNMQSTMHDRTARFFAFEHEAVMLLAVGATHMGSALARRGKSDKSRHMRAAVMFGIALLLIGYGIPWARPLFRIGS
jgi:hypothetical protein